MKREKAESMAYLDSLRSNILKSIPVCLLTGFCLPFSNKFEQHATVIFEGKFAEWLEKII
jgi:hypothetical protein